MSAVDLGGDDEFHYSGEESDYALEAGGDSGEERHSSGSDEDVGRRCTLPGDYTPLELAQRHRSRPRETRRGGSAVQCSGRGAYGQSLQRVAVGSGGVRSASMGSEVPEGGLSAVPRQLRSRRLQGAGTPEQWQRGGSVATVAGINLFTNRAPGSAPLRPLPEPTGTPHTSQQQSRPQVPRVRRRRIRKNGNWTDEQLHMALAAVDDGESMLKAARVHHIPYTTFRNWCYGRTRSRKRGVKAVLSPEEESLIVDFLIRMCDRGYGLSPSALKMKVYEITKNRVTPFKDGIPGGGWMRWFKHRHPELTIRASQGLESARAKALCPENVQSLYDNLDELYNLHHYPPERIWNCDESGAQAGNVQSSTHNAWFSLKFMPIATSQQLSRVQQAGSLSK